MGSNYAEAKTLVLDGSFAFSGNVSRVDAEITRDADVEAGSATGASIASSGSVQFTAQSSNHSVAHSDLRSAGFVALSLTAPTALVAGGTTASADGSVTNSSGVTVQATSNNFAEASTTTAQIGAISGAAAAANAEVSGDAVTDALVGANAGAGAS